ncbi:MAG: glycosyl hydrolase [Nitrospirae bacterium]|nr:glycosyl hydrolase [Nitrospirota bacterium]
MLLTVQYLKKQLQEIKSLGFIKTHLPHDPGVGRTLEDLLGLKENNFRIPDVGEVEVKAHRLDSSSMLTIATKAPQPRGANRIIFEHYKYRDSDGYYNVHSTVYGSRFNPQGFKMTFRKGKLFLENTPHNIMAYWDENIFKDVLVSKSNTIFFALAKTQGEKRSPNEQFHYIEAYLLHNLNADKFHAAIAEDYLKVDIRIGVYRSGKNKGKYHDHGTGFRMNKKDFLTLYNNYEQLI